MFVFSITGSFSGANLTIQVLHSTLVSLFKKSKETGEPLPRELHLQCYNFSRENKNRWAEWQGEVTSLLAAYNNFLPLAEKQSFCLNVDQFMYNARKGFHNATGGNVTQTEWSDDRP